MVIRERRHVSAGLGGGWTEVRVRMLEEGEELPAGAEAVAYDSPLSDWTREA